MMPFNLKRNGSFRIIVLARKKLLTEEKLLKILRQEDTNKNCLILPLIKL